MQRFYKNIGLSELDKPIFKKEKHYKKQIIKSQKAIEFQLDDEKNGEIATIFRDTLDLAVIESLDWKAFQNTFIYKIENDWLIYLTNWRIKNRAWIYKFGGNYMLVSHCEDETEFIYNKAIFKKGKTLKKLIAKKLIGQIVNISNYFKSETPKNKPEFVQTFIDDEYIKKMDYAIERNLPFYKIKIKYPFVFYDDFQDFENSKPITTKEFDVMYDGSEIIKQEKINYNFQMGIDTI